MELGPLEFLVVEFPGNKFRGEIGPALQESVDKGIIRIIDIIFMIRDENGKTTVLEMDDLDDDAKSIFDPVVEDVTGMLSEDDIQIVSETLQPNSSAALLLFEHVWATKFRDAMVRANGRLVTGGLVPREAVDATLLWLDSLVP